MTKMIDGLSELLSFCRLTNCFSTWLYIYPRKDNAMSCWWKNENDKMSKAEDKRPKLNQRLVWIEENADKKLERVDNKDELCYGACLKEKSERETLLKPFFSTRLFFFSLLSVYTKWSLLLCSANTAEPWNVTLCLWLSVHWQLCNITWSRTDSLNCFWLRWDSLITTFKACRFKVT